MNGLQKGLVSSAISALLVACGGGGGGTGATGGAGESTGERDRKGKALALNQHPVVSTRLLSASQREIEGSCKFTQTIGPAQNDGLHIAAVNWLQVVGQGAEDPDTRLVAGKDVTIRVDLLANNAGVQAPSTAKIHIYDAEAPAKACRSFRLRTSPGPVPETANISLLEDAYSARIPAKLVKPGMRAYIQFDDANGRSLAEADLTYRALAPEVVPELKLHLNVIPISYKSPGAWPPVEETGSLGDEEELKRLVTRTLPFSTVTVETQGPVAVTLDGMEWVVNANGSSGYYGYASQIEALSVQVSEACIKQMPTQLPAGTLTRCVAVLPDNLNLKVDKKLTEETFVAGLPQDVIAQLRVDQDDIRLDRKSPHKLSMIDLGGVGWPNQSIKGQEWPGALFTRSMSSVDRESVRSGDYLDVAGPYERTHWLSQTARTLVHELGHTAGLDHARCMVLDHFDDRLYADGRLGANGMGYDEYKHYYFSVQGAKTQGGLPQFADVMSYCGKEWMSDKGWRLMVDSLTRERAILPYYGIVAMK